MIPLQSNQFWGLRSGSITKKGELIFQIRRPAIKTGGNSSTPSLRRTTYRNAKLSRLSAVMGAPVFKLKGRKVGGKKVQV